MHKSDFFEKYGSAILLLMLKDKDFDLKLFYKNAEILQNKYEDKNSTKNGNIRRLATNKEIEDIYNNPTRRLPYNCLFNESHLKFIFDNWKTFISPDYYGQVLWSFNLINSYKDYIYWSALSRLSLIRWSKKRIIEYDSFLDFSQLSYNPHIEFDINLIEKYRESWDWNGLSGNPAIANQIPNLIIEFLKHPKTIWKNELSLSTRRQDFCNLNDNYESGTNIDNCWWKFSKDIRGIRPCVSTNPGIKWDINLFNSYSEKLDFWLLALYGNLDNEVIEQNAKKLKESRVVRTIYARDSSLSCPDYKSGWENLFDNKNIYIDLNLFKFLCEEKHKFNLISHTDDPINGYVPYEKEIHPIQLINQSRLVISFNELLENLEKLPISWNKPNFYGEFGLDWFGQYFINEKTYEFIIKPALLKNKDLVSDLFRQLGID